MIFLKFNYPTAKEFPGWRQQFEKSFADFLKELNRPSNEFTSPYDSTSKILALPNGGFAVYVGGVQKAVWNP